MPDPSCFALLEILQGHGLSLAVLRRWVAFCELGETGSFTVHHVDGQMKRYEVQGYGAIRQDVRTLNQVLTKMEGCV